MTQTKYWCFTINNPQAELTYNEEIMDYLLYALEVGQTNGTPHFQGYVALKKRCRLSGIKKLLGEGHYEQAKGTAEDQMAYITKDKDEDWYKLYQHGEPIGPKPGRRNDLEDLKDTIKSGAKLTTIMDDHWGSWCRFPKAIMMAREAFAEPRNHKMEIIIYWGESGSGKTHKAITDYPDHFIKENDEWWDGYEHEETVIWDEFDPRKVSLYYFCKLCDKHKFSARIKGGSLQFNSKRIIFTSNEDPTTWYNFPNERRRQAFFRRITSIQEFTEVYKE